MLSHIHRLQAATSHQLLTPVWRTQTIISVEREDGMLFSPPQWGWRTNNQVNEREKVTLSRGGSAQSPCSFPAHPSQVPLALRKLLSGG